jgi:hypothetical protein
MRCTTVLAASAAAVLAASASAETSRFLLDIPSGTGTNIDWSSTAGLEAMPFSIDSEFMNFRLGGFATEGAVRAWDFDSDTNTRGKIFLTATEGYSFTSISFDLSGFKTYESEARFKVKLNGELWKDKTWSFSGNTDLIHKDWEFDAPVTSIEIVLQNLNDDAFTGLDNINIGTVPAPGAVALLGLAGLVGNRRRRG